MNRNETNPTYLDEDGKERPVYEATSPPHQFVWCVVCDKRIKNWPMTRASHARSGKHEEKALQLRKFARQADAAFKKR